MESIRTLRKRAGLTQAELASKAGVTTTTINNLECGRNKPCKSTVARVTAALEKAMPPLHTNGDAVRRLMISDEDLINAGKVKCAGNRAKCARNCHACKLGWLRMPHNAEDEATKQEAQG